MSGMGMQALASYFKAKTVVQDVDLSHCGLHCADVKMLFTVLSMYTNQLQEIRLSCNSIGEEGAQGIMTVMSVLCCVACVLQLHILPLVKGA
jgi:Ran GTPase-activating protein (RanGAP) involved in mRNA processing and transport